MSTLDLRDANVVIELFDHAAEALRTSPWRRSHESSAGWGGSVVNLKAPGRLLITGDLHDNASHLNTVTALAKLDQSPTNHVVLQEIIHTERLVNGLDFSHRTLARVAQLVCTYPEQVHVVLANHELAQMTGRGVMKSHGNSVELFNAGLECAFGESAEDVQQAIARLVLSLPLALVAEGLLCAHSLPSPRMMQRFDENILKRNLTADDYVPPHGSAHLMVWGRAHSKEQLQALGEQWGVSLFCLGHEKAPNGIEMRGPNWLVFNSDHERGCVLPVDLSDVPSAEEALMGAIPLAAVSARES